MGISSLIGAMNRIISKGCWLIYNLTDFTIWKVGNKNLMRYVQSQMKKLVKDNKDLQKRLRELMEEHDLGKNFALKALYHSEVADGGKYQTSYQALDLPKE